MNSQRLYEHALKDLGLKESPGRASTPRIRQAIVAAAGWLDPDDTVTAWCGCIRGLWGLETGTGVPSEHFRARSWMRWGSPVGTIREAVRGDTLIFQRKGGFHVALFDRLGPDGARVFVLGGNQSNMVSVAPYRMDTLEAIRRG